MRNIFIVITFSLLGINLLSAQEIIFSEPLKIIANEKVGFNIKKGTELFATGISSTFDQGYEIIVINTHNKEGDKINFDSKKIDQFICNDIENRDKIWNKNLLYNGGFQNIILNGYQYDIRNELNNEAVEYINTLHSHNRFYEDKYFEDYLYTLVNKIHVGILKDKRPGNIFLKVIKDTEPNAFTLPNGCIVISTGLLSTIQSEDELVGILAHEIAHFVLDHHILNYNKEIDRKKKAEFWATFATVVAAGADIYLAANDKNHIPGILTTSTAIGATIVSQEVTQRLGIKYNHKQEMEADNAAMEILETLKYDKFGLSVALFRIKNYCIMTGNYLALTGSGSHPSIESRISKIGISDNLDYFTQSVYLKKVSFINSYNAWIELEHFAHHLAANELVNRNINNNVASETDYLVKAIVKRRLSNTKESNEEVLELLNKAKNLSTTVSINIYKEEAISLLRLDRKIEAKKSLNTYLISLQEIKEKNEVKEIKNYNHELEEEINWTKKMIIKIDNL